MTLPMEYKTAWPDFSRLLTDIRDTCMQQTTNQAYTTLRAVLHVFRSHLTVTDALKFADVLPPLVRAVFVEDWRPVPPLPFSSREELQREVMSVRANHNLSPGTAIADVAAALRRAMDVRDLDRVLAVMPAAARSFWAAEAMAGCEDESLGNHPGQENDDDGADG